MAVYKMVTSGELFIVLLIEPASKNKHKNVVSTQSEKLNVGSVNNCVRQNPI